MARRYRSKPKILFRPGFWKGKYYSEADCIEATENFTILSDRMVPQITIGHDTEQPMAHELGLPFDPEGYPDFGRTTSMWWDADQRAIMGVLDEMDEKVAELVNEERYTRISVVWAPEIVAPDGTEYRNVIGQVALIGAAPAGMWDQPDRLAIDGAVAHSASAQGLRTFTFAPGFTAKAITVFSDEPESASGGTAMSTELETKYTDLLERFATLEAQLATKDASIQKLLEAMSATDLDAAVTVYERQTTEIEEKNGVIAHMKETDETRDKTATEARVVAAVNEAVVNETILPKNREAEVAFAMKLDRTTAEKFTASDGKERDGTLLDRHLDGFKLRGKVIKYGGLSGDDGAGDPPGTPREESLGSDGGGGTDEVRRAAEDAIYAKVGVSRETVEKFSGDRPPGWFPGQPLPEAKKPAQDGSDS